MRYAYKPLAHLGEDRGARLVNHLYAEGARFSRAFYYYWRTVLELDEAEARRRTAEELRSSANTILSHLDDSAMFAVGLVDGGGFQPIGLFGLRPLLAHAEGAALEQAIADRYPRPYGICHALGLLDEFASLDALRATLLIVAEKSLAGGYGCLFFYTSDHRLRAIYRRFGMEFPPALAMPRSLHLVGMYDPRDPGNLARMRAVAKRLRSQDGASLVASRSERSALR